MSLKPLVTSYQPEKLLARNNGKQELRHNERIWSPGVTIEVSEKDAEDLHKQGFEILDDQNIREEKEKEEEKKASELKDGPSSFDPKSMMKKEGE